MTVSSSIVFTRKAVANETFIGKSNSLCKSIVGIDASKLFPYSMRPQVCIRDATSMKKRKNSRQGKIEFLLLKIGLCNFFKQPDLGVKLRATTLQEPRKISLLQC